jgi:preprotein translocase subunit SecY
LIGGFQNIPKIPELKKRIFFTLCMLAVYRLGCHIPTPGIDSDALASFFDQRQGGLFGLMDMFAGGALFRMSVMALGIMPYISASIILELLSVVVPYLEKLKKEGEQGRKKIIQYTRYGTVVLSSVQGFGIAIWLENMTLSSGGPPVVTIGGWGFRLLAVITFTAGTAFLMWLGEQITERGIGNGISLIIYSGIVASFFPGVFSTIEYIRIGQLSAFFMLIIVVFMVGIVGFIVFMERGQRRIPVQYAKRVVGRRMYGGQSTHLPLKVNTAGVIPPIFASSILMFPITIVNYVNVDVGWLNYLVQNLSPDRLLYNIIYMILIIFFCYFYTAVHFNPVDVADNMKKYGGFIPGIRPGKNTAEYIDRVLTRITFSGAIYVSFVCILPNLLTYKANVPFYFGGTGLLIVVGVAMDTANQIESHMLTRHYEGFMKTGLARGGR